MAIINVGPDVKNPTHEISLSDGVEVWGLKLENGPAGVREGSQQPSTLRFTGGGTKFGDYEPSLSHIEQRTWKGGRGQEDFVDDATRFYDSQSAWTLTPNRLLPSLQWKFARNVRSNDTLQPGNMTWKALTGTTRYVSVGFAASASYSADKAYMWVRRRGSPGTLTFELCANTAGDPGTVLQTVTKNTTNITDVISVFQVFDWTSTESLTSGTTYHVKVYGASTDSAANHWEVGVSTATSSGKISSDNTTWAGVSYTPYYRVVVADVDRKWIPFTMDSAFYAVDKKAASTASTLLINGDRGKATSATSTTLTDTNKSWTTNDWNNARVRIIRGTGAGQNRAIASNTATALTVTAWSTTPDSTSEYVIYDSDKWTELGTTGITGVVNSVAVENNIADFAQGSAVNIRRLRFNAAAAPPAHEYEDNGTNKADLLYTFYATGNAPKLYRALNGSTMEVSSAALTAWAAAATFGTAVPIGDDAFQITGLIGYDGLLYVAKEDSLWQLTAAEVATPVPVGLDALPGVNNGAAITTQNLYLYFSWSHSVEQYFSASNSSLSDIGQWKDAGLPSDRRGPNVALTPYIGWLFAGIDAGTSGFSSVMATESGAGWHELFRAWETGQRVQSIKFQSIPDGRPRLWISVGGDLVYMDFPQDAINPLSDTTLNYVHEAVVIGSSIDMGSARLPKGFKEHTLLTNNLASGREIALDYQLDEDIGTSTWAEAGTAYGDPESVISIRQGDRRRYRPRLRLMTDDADEPPQLLAAVLEAFARTPDKRQWNMRIKISNLQRDRIGRQDKDPDDFFIWLKQASRSAKYLRMHSVWEAMDDLDVLIEPPGLGRATINTITGWWSGVVLLTVREA